MTLGLPPSPPPDGREAAGCEGGELSVDGDDRDGRDGDGNDGEGNDGTGDDDGEGRLGGEGSEGGEGSDGLGVDCGERLLGLLGLLGNGFGIPCGWEDGSGTLQPASANTETAARARIADGRIDGLNGVDEGEARLMATS